MSQRMTRINANRLFVFFVIFVVSFFSCREPSFNDYKSQDIPDGWGRVTVSLTQGDEQIPLTRSLSRAIPEKPTVLDFFDHIDFVFIDGTTTITKTLDNDQLKALSGNPTFDLETGSYTLTVNAYMSDSSAALAASGTSDSFTVSSGTAIPIEVNLYPVTTGTANGTFSFSIKYPSGAQVDVLKLVHITGTEITGGAYSNLKTGASTTGTNPITMSSTEPISVTPGHYLLIAQLSNGTGYTGEVEYVLISSGMNTTIEWEFEDNHFDAIPLVVTVSAIDYTTTIPADFKALSPLDTTATLTVEVSGFVSDTDANGVTLNIADVTGLSYSGHTEAGNAASGTKTFTVTVTYSTVTQAFTAGEAELSITVTSSTIPSGNAAPASATTQKIAIRDGQSAYSGTGVDRRIPVAQANITTFNTYANANLSRHFVLTENITLSAPVPPATSNWTPIGSSGTNQSFTGSFDGNGNTITELTINNGSSDYQGLFGSIGSGGKVENLGLVGGSVTGGSYVGSIAGFNAGTITGCYNTGNITGTSAGGQNIGGIAGCNTTGGTISNCYNIGSVEGNNGVVGGIAGLNNSTVQYCYNTGNVTGGNGTSSGINVGGIVGSNSGSVQYNIALNLNVIGFIASSGRIAGNNTSSGTLSNNYARTDMRVKDDTVTGNISDKNGGSALSTHTIAGVFQDFTSTQSNGSSIWSILDGVYLTDNQPLPTLRNVGGSQNPTLPAQTPSGAYTYIITAENTANTFTATRGGGVVGTGAIQSVIEAIRTNAATNDCTIIFGVANAGGTYTAVNVGGSYIQFATANWGDIILQGSITGMVNTNNTGIININSGCAANITSYATINNNGSGTTAQNIAINHNGSGELTIAGGQVSALAGYAISKQSAASSIRITDGTVSTTSGYTISISSDNTAANPLTITGGTVSATTGRAISNGSNIGTVAISGGTVSATSGVAIRNANTGAVTISGGKVEATTGQAINNAGAGTITISETDSVLNPTLITSANVKSSVNDTVNAGTIYNAGILNIYGGTIENEGADNTTTAKSVITNDGTLKIEGGNISNTAGSSFRVIDNVGTASISGSLTDTIITASGNTSNAVWVRNTPEGAATATVTISGGTITSNNIAATGSNSSGTIYVANGTDTRLKINGGTIRNNSGNANARAIYIAGSNENNVSITDGIVEITNDIAGAAAIENAGMGTLEISGGTVRATLGQAIRNSNMGAVTISQTSTTIPTLITSANTTDSAGTIVLAAPTNDNTNTRLTITGGTVQNTANDENARAIYNNSTGGVNISGGTITAQIIEGTPNIAIQSTQATSSITLGGAPTITGRIRTVTGVVSAQAGFAPVNKCILDFGTLPSDNVDQTAVTNGASFISNFELYNPGNYKLKVGGTGNAHLVIVIE